MSGGKGKDQLKCLRGVTRRVTQSHKVLFCTVQGNGCGPGRVFLFKRVTPLGRPSKSQGNCDVLTSRPGPRRANCFPSLASYCIPGVVRAVGLQRKERSLGPLPEDQLNCVPWAVSSLGPLFKATLHHLRKKKKKKAFEDIILQNKSDTRRYKKA